MFSDRFLGLLKAMLLRIMYVVQEPNAVFRPRAFGLRLSAPGQQYPDLSAYCLRHHCRTKGRGRPGIPLLLSEAIGHEG